MRWISTIAGIIAASAAVLVIASLPQHTAGEATPEVPQAVIQIADPVPASPTTLIVEESAPGLPVSGLDQAVSDALIASGYTEFIGETDLGSNLDPAIAQVLTDEGAVLVIANDDAAADEGEG